MFKGEKTKLNKKKNPKNTIVFKVKSIMFLVLLFTSIHVPWAAVSQKYKGKFHYICQKFPLRLDQLIRNCRQNIKVNVS